MSKAAAAQGDVVLARVLDGLASSLARSVAVSVIERGRIPETRFAFIDANPQRRFEIGSITKGLTGMLLADAIDRGVISLDTTVNDVVPSFAGSEVGSITVQELCTHTSGLPRTARRPYAPLRGLRYGVLQLNPYHGITTSDMLELAARQHLSDRGHRRYSNLGAAILGQLLAIRSDAEYPHLLKERILLPMGLGSTEVAQRKDTAPWGRSRGDCPDNPGLWGDMHQQEASTAPFGTWLSLPRSSWTVRPRGLPPWSHSTMYERIEKTGVRGCSGSSTRIPRRVES